MRYWIIGIITIVIFSFLIAYNPNSKYLGVYTDDITIELEGIDDGYKWSYEINNDNLKLNKEGVLSNNDYEEKNDKELYYWNWLPVKDGETKIVFKYSKENHDLYTIYYELKIVKNKIYWTKGEAKGLTDYPNPY